MRKHTELLLGLVVILALVAGLVAGCAPAATPTAPPAATPTSPPPAPTPTTPPPAGPKRGGILKWARADVPRVLDPIWTLATQDMHVFMTMYEPLLRVTLDGSGLEPALAESWDISDDGLVYTFHLRPGVKFHDGSLVKASDIVWSLNRAANPEAEMWNWTLENVKGVEAVDDSTVKITLKAPAANFLTMLSIFNTTPFPQKLVEEMGEEEFFKHPIGTGPFKMTEWVPAESITFEKNPYYWDLGEDGEPLPYLDGVEITQVPEDTTRVMQVQSGSIDGTDTIPFSMIGDLETDPSLQTLLFPSTRVWIIVLNHRRPPMDDVKVRQAMNYAVDRQALLDAILFGYGEPSTSFRPRGTMCYNSDLEGFPYDLEKAQQLMAESNYPDGFKLPVLVGAGRSVDMDQVLMLKEMWAKIGIEVEVEELEMALLQSTCREGNFIARDSWGWTDDIPDPQGQSDFYCKGPDTYWGWNNDRATELCEAAALELDQDKRCEMYEEIQEIFNEDAVNILLFQTPLSALLGNDVKGFYWTPLGWLLWRETWLDR